MRRVSLLALIVTVLVLAHLPAASAKARVGPNRLPTSGTCTFKGDRLTVIKVRAPKAKMRTYWTKPHGGRVADAQYVEYILQLDAKKAGGKWKKVASKHSYTLVGKQWKRLKKLSGFKKRSGLRSKYAAFRLVQTVRWLKPTNNRVEGKVRRVVGAYADGTMSRPVCVRAHPRVATAALPQATIGTAYSTQLQAQGVAPWTWSLLSGTVPGLTLNASGVLSGKAAATARGAKVVTVQATDANGLVAAASIALTVDYLKGDANGDGLANCTDLNLIRANQGLAPFTRARGDINDDAKIDAADETAFKTAVPGDKCARVTAVRRTAASPPAGCAAPCYQIGATVINVTYPVTCTVNASKAGTGTKTWSVASSAQAWSPFHLSGAAWASVTCAGATSPRITWS